MKAAGSDLIITNVLNDEGQAVLTILVGRSSSLEQRLEACEFLVEEIKAGIKKQAVLEAEAAKAEAEKPVEENVEVAKE